ncbi:hypothetical protein [Limnohabitans sp. 63ED37-2]|uniref:hypothetical protein n=1 Tax=Limnohabitans sp. 63ED37-2 TaxID=1678128 RepID=UPI000706B830|nr:hypothetical protein [Limnohabitans sp. 63ED37-2]ALK87435.1 hypothetical protein L63ED372_00206 [Limnohabitans sp. 63ED37-2]
MFKYWLALLLVLHALVLAWHWDAFAPWGHGPDLQREPERLKQQVHPEALKFEVLPPSASTTAPTAEAAVSDTSAVARSAASAPDVSSPAPALPSSAAVAPRAKP